MSTRPTVADRPNLRALDPAEVEARKRVLAQTPTPRDGCPGCLRDLSGYPQQRKRGWCRLCWPSRDAILAELLRAPDPRWKKPAAVVRAERAVLEATRTAERLREAAEEAFRAAAKLAADLRYLRSEMKICLDCGEALTSTAASATCFRCGDWREAGIPGPEPRDHFGNPHHGHPSEYDPPRHLPEQAGDVEETED